MIQINEYSNINLKNFIWSKGPFNNNYSKKNTYDISSEDEIIKIIESSSKYIWIRLGSTKEITDLEIFSKYIDKLKDPIVLITSDGDRLVPSSYDNITVQNIINSKNIKSWYTQNYDMTIINPKLKHYPIGLDLHTTKWLVNNSSEEKLKFMINMRKQNPINKRNYGKILSDTHNSNSHPDRVELYNSLINNPNIVFTKGRLRFEQITTEYNKYNFALSPKGKGLDCHRTWELFLAGVIVITKSCELDDMYKNKDLPIVIINDWNELNNGLDKKLDFWYEKFSNLTSFENIYPKMLFNYWLI